MGRNKSCQWGNKDPSDDACVQHGIGMSLQYLNKACCLDVMLLYRVVPNFLKNWGNISLKAACY